MGLWDLFGITEILNGPSPNSNKLPPEFGSQYNILEGEEGEIPNEVMCWRRHDKKVDHG